MRRTKILATLGPSSDSPRIIEGLIKVGVDVVRLNFSHGEPEEHIRRARTVRRIAARLGRYVGVLGDLQGPKIRVERFREGRVQLRNGQRFTLDSSLDRRAGSSKRVGVTYAPLAADVEPGDTLVLDDGRIVLEVLDVDGTAVHTRVSVGGTLSDNKGINLRGGGLSAPAITEKDRRDIKLAARIGVDFLAVSFPRCADDLHLARSLLRKAAIDGAAGETGYGEASIVAKVERAEALEVIGEIVEASDAIMVARGDLGVEIGDAELPAVQKELISRAREANRAVITATQMMESMIDNPIPTRAEVFDVANAVMDGTDAVMLSAESAAGRFPVQAVRAMTEICEKAEQHPRARISRHRIDQQFDSADEAVAMATMYTANHLDVKAIAALTESGRTPMWMSRISSGIPIYALSSHDRARARMTLYRGVYPVDYDSTRLTNSNEANRAAVEILAGQRIVGEGDLVVITKGDVVGAGSHTNSMKIVRVGDWLSRNDEAGDEAGDGDGRGDAAE